MGNAVGALMQGMDRARGVPHRTWLHTKIVGIKFAAIWAVLMTMVNALLLVGQDLINWATDRWNLQNDARGSLLDILFPAVALLLMVMLWVLYRYGPHAPRRRLLPLLPPLLEARDHGPWSHTQGGRVVKPSDLRPNTVIVAPTPSNLLARSKNRG